MTQMVSGPTTVTLGFLCVSMTMEGQLPIMAWMSMRQAAPGSRLTSSCPMRGPRDMMKGKE